MNRHNKKEQRAFFRSLLAAKKNQKDFRGQCAKTAAVFFTQSPLFTQTSVILAFYATETEIDTQPIIDEAFKNTKKIALPRMRNNEIELDFYYLDPKRPLQDQLEKHPYGIQEPLTTLEKVQPADFAQNIVILVPGLAFTKDGKRLGQGKGYYDRFISRLEKENPAAAISLVGLCFSFQITDKITCEKHDKSVTHVLTEKGLFRAEQKPAD